MAKLAVDRIVEREGREAPCRTHEIPLGEPVGRRRPAGGRRAWTRTAARYLAAPLRPRRARGAGARRWPRRGWPARIVPDLPDICWPRRAFAAGHEQAQLARRRAAAPHPARAAGRAGAGRPGRRRARAPWPRRWRPSWAGTSARSSAELERLARRWRRAEGMTWRRDGPAAVPGRDDRHRARPPAPDGHRERDARLVLGRPGAPATSTTQVRRRTRSWPPERRPDRRRRRVGRAPIARRSPVEEELARVVPLVERLAADGVLVSVDTWSAPVARAALAAGAAMINDVSGLLDPELADACADGGRGARDHAHARAARRRRPTRDYDDVSPTCSRFLRERMGLALERGVDAGADRARPGHRLRQDPGRDGARCCARLRRVGGAGPAAAAGGVAQGLRRARSPSRRPRERLAGTLAAVGEGGRCAAPRSCACTTWPRCATS